MKKYIALLRQYPRKPSRNDLNKDLHIAIEKGEPATVLAILKSNADVNHINQNDKTPLHVGAEKGDKTITQILLESGANINAPTKHGYTPLHWAAIMGREAVSEILL